MLPKRPVITFNQYLQRRDYQFRSFSGLMFKMIRKSFLEKSFCRFWRMWNPFTGYLFFLFFSFLGGNRYRPFLIIFVFITSGFLFHDLLIYLLTGRVSIIFTVTFFIYSMIFITEQWIANKAKARRRSGGARTNPIQFYILLNIVLLAVPLVIGIVANTYFSPYAIIEKWFN